MTADLDAHGYDNQTSVDFADVVIGAMKEKYAGVKTVWRVMDVRDLQLDDASVDFAIDKMTLDSFINGSVWDPPIDVRTNVERYVQEVSECLRSFSYYADVYYLRLHEFSSLEVSGCIFRIDKLTS